LLTIDANDTLTRDAVVPGGVTATARNGDLTLTGTVSYGGQRADAEAAVAAVTGVRGIRNRVQVRNDTEPAG
jgi:osmotically-inducible protein OsmY